MYYFFGPKELKRNFISMLSFFEILMLMMHIANLMVCFKFISFILINLCSSFGFSSIIFCPCIFLVDIFSRVIIIHRFQNCIVHNMFYPKKCSF